MSRRMSNLELKNNKNMLLRKIKTQDKNIKGFNISNKGTAKWYTRHARIKIGSLESRSKGTALYSVFHENDSLPFSKVILSSMTSKV